MGLGFRGDLTGLEASLVGEDFFGVLRFLDGVVTGEADRLEVLGMGSISVTRASIEDVRDRVCMVKRLTEREGC